MAEELEGELRVKTLEATNTIKYSIKRDVAGVPVYSLAPNMTASLTFSAAGGATVINTTTTTRGFNFIRVPKVDVTSIVGAGNIGVIIMKVNGVALTTTTVTAATTWTPAVRSFAVNAGNQPNIFSLSINASGTDTLKGNLVTGTTDGRVRINDLQTVII